MPTAPFIPDSAPFSPAQRAWLNGFLAGMWSSPPQPVPVAAAASRNVAVLYASQTGTSERLAKKIAKELTLKGHTARVTSVEGYAAAALSTEECAVILASTYGEGDPPDTARAFFDQLCDRSAPRLEKLRYSVLALGDSQYEYFCKFGVDLDERLTALGARRLSAAMTCDVEADGPFEIWKTRLLEQLSKLETMPPVVAEGVVAETVGTPVAGAGLHPRHQAFEAELKEKRVLTRDIEDVSGRLTLHMCFSLAGSALNYDPGDALAVAPTNDPALVAEILERAKLSGGEMVELPNSGAESIADALSSRLQITRLSRKLVAAFANAGDVTALLEILRPEQQTDFDRYIHERGLVDLLAEYPGVISGARQLADLLPKLAPRLYSISSSPGAHAGEVHATVAVVRYRSHHRERGGVCSTMFADRAEVGDRLPVYIQRNKHFRLPENSDAPIIMVGPGTGIAPFRSFLHERCATGAKGRNWLFFGERNAATDFLYREELERMAASGVLTRLDTAFSRDQAHKIYVQDRMFEQGAELFAWLEQGAGFYVCGDASRMARDVDFALHKVIERHGNRDEEGARDYVQSLHDAKRYHRDVY